MGHGLEHFFRAFLKKLGFLGLFALGVALLPTVSFAGTLSGGESLCLDGSQLAVFWLFPFVGLLLSLALLPATLPELWHKHFGKITVCWVAAVLLPLLWVQGADLAIRLMLEILLNDYIPFILMIATLYILSSSLHIEVHVPGKPIHNTFFLMMGSLVANLIGTTGAAMLLIHPLLRMNRGRTYQVHTIVFFIFTVCNIGGSLSPVGDPPLFIGFLNGIPFLWPLLNLLKPFLMVWVPVLVVYFLIDTFYFYPKEPDKIQEKEAPSLEKRLTISGKEQILLFGIALSTLIISGVYRSGISFTIWDVSLKLEQILRDLILVGCILASWVLGSPDNRKANHFSWIPLEEVAILFVGIFVTAAPVISILQAGSNGCLTNIFAWMMPGGEPSNMHFFWITGVLSAFLDNAPTYLSFFHVAGGDPKMLTGPLNSTLMAISTGAVFMGALTYIGNAPNLMVRAIVDKKGIPMPHFFGYMGWSLAFLIPFYLLASLWFFL